MALNSRMHKTGSPGLFIIHYGGHGDPDDDKRQGQERRSVWRAYRSGGPDVKWYKILQEFEDTTFDVLLLFDCCHAAQGGRGSESLPGRVELLAACGVREKTIDPGAGSFTTGLILGMKKFLEEKGRVLISELNSHLTHRKADLYVNPVYIQLRLDQTERSVSLVPLSYTTERESDQTIWRSTICHSRC
ncbi:hypothetical protein P171DRAFT_429047 [Karstenula rhodostoma CBS 690.94]|uniref:Uncharacterized protein n=1 Tax=Karstenula rhodostoma CBS 690.94 TaxID=1392251 RepID=A0A9P4PQA4_9PLEO|nr:hypothetical protein P171DRAFT_429047 [Karstenula rhodostoma CBS 690.94]